MVTISTGAFFERANLQIGSLRKKAEALQSQVGSGDRLTRSSDDPIAAAKLRTLSRRSVLNGVDQRNSDLALTDLRLADKAMASVASLVIRARDLALQAKNNTLGDEQLAQIGIEVATLRENLFALANAKDGAGHALFGGETEGLAYVEAGGVYTYNGTANPPTTELGDGQKIQRTVTGPQFLNVDPAKAAGAADLFEVLNNFVAGMSAGGAAAVAAAGDALAGLDAGLEKVTTSQTLLGTRMAWVETIDDRRVVLGELIADEQASVGGADLASTITRLQEVMTVLEASQASFVRLSNLSLFNQLK